MTRYGITRKQIMVRAWELYRGEYSNRTFRHCLIRAWAQAQSGMDFGFFAPGALPVPPATEAEKVDAAITGLEMTDRLGVSGLAMLSALRSRRIELSRAA